MMFKKEFKDNQNYIIRTWNSMCYEKKWKREELRMDKSLLLLCLLEFTCLKLVQAINFPVKDLSGNKVFRIIF